MTDEQIKQNAEEYILKEYPKVPVLTKCAIAGIFAAGAHSLDEEIEELKERLKYADESIADADKWIAKYKLELDKLNNPWISVEERLPVCMNEISTTVIRTISLFVFKQMVVYCIKWQCSRKKSHQVENSFKLKDRLILMKESLIGCRSRN